MKREKIIKRTAQYKCTLQWNPPPNKNKNKTKQQHIFINVNNNLKPEADHYMYYDTKFNVIVPDIIMGLK